ncbi:hypothetical protein M441DRAFT_242727 [Trichoderma asperellum CBS 433.97]|uniref:Uncharacterized protein n=2 Tax=Trichoderma asperellum TaxID=101201 RepID=A0A2T3Z2G0_TRIA4|nr:hypothetical protein M441DRAFT_242727 [Trichoderma asperellum CBS 433.97]PTB38994.1 hypothetical protein M441DRAFT_242727 [Trichoderma asperellum CBS 433.97]
MRQIDSKKSRGLASYQEQQADPKQRHSLPLMGVPPGAPTPGVPPQTGPRKRGRPRKSLVDPYGNVMTTNKGPQARSQTTEQPITPALAYKTGYGNGNEVLSGEARRQQTREHYEQYIAYRGRAPPIQAQAQAQTGFEYVSRLTSEAQVRVALDYVAHAQGNVSMKERHIAALFHRLEQVRIQSGISQS